VLKSNNVTYVVDTTWVDPALKSEDYKQFRMIIILPQNYYNFTHPWKKDIDPYLEEVWSYNSEGQAIARLFKVNVS
jgi:hypothetical protein